MLFEFKLRPIDEVAPWGAEPELSLSWFGLTDGFYRINVGTERLFTYSESSTRLLAAKYPGFTGDYEDYQVVRLWEDICTILPDALDPVPSALADLLLGPTPKVNEWLIHAYSFWTKLDDQPESEIGHQLYETATDWLHRRSLDSMYLRAGPRMWIWSTDDLVTITWDNRGLELEGVEAWSAHHGSFSMPRSKFIQEVRDFDARLIDQMKARVEQVCTKWNRPNVHIDFEVLRLEQIERAQAMPKALAVNTVSPDWRKVSESMKRIGESF